MFQVSQSDARSAPREPQRQARAAVLALALLGVSLPLPAYAQFNFFGLSEASVQDVYDSIADHGFRLAGPLMRNGNVYVADVLDRGQRRERLIISTRNAQIVQRFYVDVGGPSRPLPPPDSSWPRTARNSDDEGFFSRLTRGWDDNAPPRPPLGMGNGDPEEPIMPRPLPRRLVRPKPTDIEPQVATRHEESTIKTAPLAAPAPTAPASAQPASAPQPATASVPATAPAQANLPAATPSRPTVVLTDPLRIPGEKPKEAPKPTASTAAAAPVRPEPARAEPARIETPKPALPPKPKDVPVAPLD